MPRDRMRMRPWLEKMINSHKIDGVTWLDQVRGLCSLLFQPFKTGILLKTQHFHFVFLQEKTMFSVPWKHAARHGWEIEKDASLFKLWAIHTGEQLISCCANSARTVRGL